jgi:hypothetical protein
MTRAFFAITSCCWSGTTKLHAISTQIGRSFDATLSSGAGQCPVSVRGWTQPLFELPVSTMERTSRRNLRPSSLSLIWSQPVPLAEHCLCNCGKMTWCIIATLPLLPWPRPMSRNLDPSRPSVLNVSCQSLEKPLLANQICTRSAGHWTDAL